MKDSGLAVTAASAPITCGMKEYITSLPAVGAVPYSSYVPINDRMGILAIADRQRAFAAGTAGAG